jgi:hypothetical protein
MVVHKPNTIHTHAHCKKLSLIYLSIRQQLYFVTAYNIGLLSHTIIVLLLSTSAKDFFHSALGFV